MIATTMQVWQLRKLGIPGLALIEQPVPEPGPTDLLVKIDAVSLNYRDHLLLEGRYGMMPTLPLVPASDAAGTVVAVGPRVQRFRVGARIIGHYTPRWIDAALRSVENGATLGGPLPGVLAEYRLFDEQAAAAAPAHLDQREAATLPIAALTAWTALFEHTHLSPADTLLVQGTGGVSLFALQLAAAAGARVIVLSRSDEKLERVRSLGAWATINSTRDPEWDRRVLELTGGRGVDRVLELIGGDNARRSVRALAVGGELLLIGMLEADSLSFEIIPFMLKQGIVRGVAVGNRQQLEAMISGLTQLRVRPVIERVYGFTDAPAAFEHASRGPFGKLVIDVG